MYTMCEFRHNLKRCVARLNQPETFIVIRNCYGIVSIVTIYNTRYPSSSRFCEMAATMQMATRMCNVVFCALGLLIGKPQFVASA